MTTEEHEGLGGAVKASWRRFLDTYEPLRPDLYRYCRHLTRSPWDAEDMAQETMARAFVTLAIMTEPPSNPRAWLFRVASNLWINRTRQTRELPAAFGAHVPEPATGAEPRAIREAAGTLMAQLSPQERAAVASSTSRFAPTGIRSKSGWNDRTRPDMTGVAELLVQV